MNNFVSFELTDTELQSLRELGWGHGRTDLVCQSIVRDYIRRNEAKARRLAAKRERRPQRERFRDAGAG